MVARRWQDLTARQFGVLSRAQAFACGLTRNQVGWLLKQAEWAVVHPGVYRATGAPSAWPQALMAATLWAGEGAVVSHQAAAALWELEGFWRTRVELSGPALQAPPRGVRIFRVRRLDRADVQVLQGIRVTTAARTLLDLAAAVPERVLERALDESLRRGLVTVDQVQWCLERNGRRGRRGAARLAALLTERRGQVPNDSPLETDAGAVFRRAGLPAPVRNHEIVEGGKLVARVDLAWPHQKVVVQAHGGVHRQPRNWERDQLVESQLAASGWRVLKVTRRMLDDAPELAATLVRRALGAAPRRR